MRTETINIYQFNELSNEAKQNAIKQNYDINVSHDWWTNTYEDAERIGLQITSFDLERNKHAKGAIIGMHEETARLIQPH